MRGRQIPQYLPFIPVCAAVLLSIAGLAEVASSGSVVAGDRLGTPTMYMWRQLVYIATGGIVCTIFAKIRASFWTRPEVMNVLMLLSVLGLISVFIPGFGSGAKGSRRWIDLGFVSLQPSEFVRIAVTLVLAGWYGKISRRISDFKEGFFYPALAVSVVLLLLLKEPDFGAMGLTALMTLSIMVIAGVRMKYIFVSGTAFLAAAAVLVLQNPERIGRVFAFLHPDTSSQGDGWQVSQALRAFRNGGLSGVGYWDGMQREKFLPEAHTDFILAMLGEEFGLVCTVTIVMLYATILYCGIRASTKTDNRHITLMSFGLTMHICFSAAYNIAVVTRFAPTKGLALPFVSYGGSSMIASWLAMGLLISAMREINLSCSELRVFKNRPIEMLPVEISAQEDKDVLK